MLEKTLESLLDSKEIQPVNPKEINPEYSLEGQMLKLQNFGHLMQSAGSLEKALMLGKIEGRRRRDDRGGQLSLVMKKFSLKSDFQLFLK